jgi:hypothetical protein
LAEHANAVPGGARGLATNANGKAARGLGCARNSSTPFCCENEASDPAAVAIGNSNYPRGGTGRGIGVATHTRSKVDVAADGPYHSVRLESIEERVPPFEDKQLGGDKTKTRPNADVTARLNYR